MNSTNTTNGAKNKADRFANSGLNTKDTWLYIAIGGMALIAFLKLLSK